jgi:predicted GNAT family N-acyltransferase
VLSFSNLCSEHDKASFDCGVEDLNLFLRENASSFVKRGLCAVHVLADESNIIGYYTLSASSIPVVDLPEKIAKKYPARMPIPSWLLGKLAVDKKYHGKGYGKIVLCDALNHILKLRNDVGGYCVIVDARDTDVKNFYIKYGFTPFPESNLRLYMPASDIV